jgi:hypothetical protein
LENRERYGPMREAARQYVMANFDANTVCVPRLKQLLQIKHDAPAARPNEAADPKTPTSEHSKTELPPNEWAPATRPGSRAVSRS